MHYKVFKWAMSLNCVSYELDITSLFHLNHVGEFVGCNEKFKIQQAIIAFHLKPFYLL